MARKAKGLANRLHKREQINIDVAQWQVPPDEARSAVPDNPMTALFFDHEGYLIHKWTHYLAAYDQEFGPFRLGVLQPDGSRRPVRMLEIGVSNGGSLQLWRSYFGPEASIWGIDIDERCAALEGDFTIRIGSQADPGFLRSLIEEMGGVDIVLDDGSHVAQDQEATFRTLFPLLINGGLYVVEDLHTSYWPNYGGGYGRAGTFIETAKALVDDMHASYHDRGDSQGVSGASTITRITIYDSIIFIAKGSRPPPMVTMIGTPTL